MITKIIKCDVLPEYKLNLLFHDGASGIVDLGQVSRTGVFTIWEDYDEFKKVKIDPITHTLCWNNIIDLDPIILRKSIE
jgi:hypothetical protein